MDITSPGYGDYSGNYWTTLDDPSLNDSSYEFDVPAPCEAGEQEATIKLVQSCVFCLVFLLGVAGNALVIATFALYRRFRLRSLTDLFLLHLAVADLLLLLTLPLQGVGTHLGWLFSTPLCKATLACYAVNTYSGLLLLACISVDRYVAVVWAQEALRLRRRFHTGGKMASLAVWLAALLLSLPEILFSGVDRSASGQEAYCVIRERAKVKMISSATLIAVFCLSSVVMMVCYSRIAKVLWEGRESGRSKGWQRQRSLKLMVALVAVFLLFQLPYTVVLLHKMSSDGASCHLLLEYITCALAYARCCLNPILYALVGVRFRGDVMKLVGAVRCPGGRRAPKPGSCSSASPSSLALTAL